MWHWLLDFLLIVCFFFFMIDKLTLLWVRRCYGLFYSITYRTGGYLIFVDIDNFKKFNDQYGHKTGDKILRKIGKAVLAESRFRGFRYGGDELTVLLPWGNKDKAIRLAHRIRERVERENANLGVTVTCVVVKKEEQIQCLIKDAKKGKNTVKSFLEKQKK